MENMEKTMISVAICTFNGEKYIRKQLLSILNQSIKVDEIIVVDDCSNDHTLKILYDVLDKSKIPHQIIVNQKNVGVMSSFEKALCMCSGDILFTCDQDDIWKKEKVQLFMEVFENRPDVSLVFSNGELINENEQSLKTTLWTKLNFKMDNKLDFKQLLKSNVVTGSAMAVRKNIVDMALPFPHSWLHDGWLALVSYALGKIYALPKITYLYRIHSENVVGVGENTFWKKFKNWKKKIEHMPEIYQIKYERYNLFLQRYGNQMTEEETILLDDCINFWKTLNRLAEKKKLYAAIEILRFGLMGKYHKYYTGRKGMLRDLLYTFSKH